ncbi:hypothetical protein AB870_05085 [Pandoraea faecigallinarum]|uniref:Uncharacterized protein n=1 Tax=Pandoraea faecigallinarum TaxID=656179 RepID=A0A0H3WNR3_9BURK|nr:hypothetical protein [Pandoraea faecigallinarum]AKM29634.1 hypothetical protein AB870_05085 [Pandoraea faecigallinarum]
MPLNRFPKAVTRCLGLPSPDETSAAPPPRANAMARNLTGTLNRTPALRGPGGVSHASAQASQTAQPSPARHARNSAAAPVHASVDPSPDMPMTMAADWQNPATCRVRTEDRTEAQRPIAMPIRLWECDDPSPDWASSTRAMAQDWADRYGVNTSRLIRVGAECTRYGLIDLGGHRFIVGPTATPAEARVLTLMLKTNPQIGAVFCVEPGALGGQHEPREAQTRHGYCERPISAYLCRVARRSADPREADAPAGTPRPSTSSRPSPPSYGHLEGGLSHVRFMAFDGMTRIDAKIDSATLWRAGKGVADFMRDNPGKIPLVCSEHGIARPCAVIASAALQLQDGDVRLRSQLGTEAIRQRSQASDHHIGVAARGLDLIAELARLSAMLRAPGRGDPRWERKVVLLRQRLPELVASGHVDWQSREGRRRLADILEANFERVAPLLASGGLPPGTALLWLHHEVDVLCGVRFLSPAYVGAHVDRISQEDVDPQSRDAVRLVSLDDYGLTCDNKYYDVRSVADWHRECERRGSVLTNPISRSPVVALLVHATQKARLENEFRT